MFWGEELFHAVVVSARGEAGVMDKNGQLYVADIVRLSILEELHIVLHLERHSIVYHAIVNARICVSGMKMVERELLWWLSAIISHAHINFSSSPLRYLMHIWSDIDSRAMSLDCYRDLSTLRP